MVTKRIVLLANSRKHAERCLAGREIANQQLGGWIRPVSARPGEGLDEHERRYEGNIEPAVLDIIDVPLLRANPHACQTENWLVSRDEYWVRRGSITWDQAVQIAETHPILWVNGFHTYHGLNDEIPQARANGLATSICMIRVQSVDIDVVNGYNAGTKKVYAYFEHEGNRYKLSLTDSIFEPHFKAGPIGSGTFGESLLTISLSEPFTKNDGSVCQYKLVAALIPQNNEIPEIT